MTSAMKRASQIGLGAAIFVAGIAAGSLHARSTAVQNRFGQPQEQRENSLSFQVSNP